jgi:hypothetical protein
MTKVKVSYSVYSLEDKTLWIEDIRTRAKAVRVAIDYVKRFGKTAEVQDYHQIVYNDGSRRWASRTGWEFFHPDLRVMSCERRAIFSQKMYDRTYLHKNHLKDRFTLTGKSSKQRKKEAMLYELEQREKDGRYIAENS